MTNEMLDRFPQQPISKEKIIEATPLPTECRCCQKTDCYNCDHASKRWTLSKKQELLLLRKLKEKAILRFKRQIEEIDYQIAMMEEAKR